MSEVLQDRPDAAPVAAGPGLQFHVVYAPMRMDAEVKSFATEDERTRDMVAAAENVLRYGDGCRAFLFDGAKIPFTSAPIRRLKIGGVSVTVDRMGAGGDYLTPPPNLE